MINPNKKEELTLMNVAVIDEKKSLQWMRIMEDDITTLRELRVLKLLPRVCSYVKDFARDSREM